MAFKISRELLSLVGQVRSLLIEHGCFCFRIV